MISIKRYKNLIGLTIILATFTAFGRYLYLHPDLIKKLLSTPPQVVGLTILLNLAIFGCLCLILKTSLAMFNKPISFGENFMLSAYSSLINFFGPGQSGPGFRAVYLKVRHGLKFKNYIYATLLYYAFFAGWSSLLLLAGSRLWKVAPLLLALVAGVSWLVIRRQTTRQKPDNVQTSRSSQHLVLWLGLLTLAQVLLTTMVYFIQLRSLDAHVSLAQAASYTGAANFAMFVALTPGAIGFREAFLLFSQRLHHISSENIVGANLIDRSAYIVFLGLLFAAVLGLHANRKFQLGKIRAAAIASEAKVKEDKP